MSSTWPHQFQIRLPARRQPAPLCRWIATCWSNASGLDQCRRLHLDAGPEPHRLRAGSAGVDFRGASRGRAHRGSGAARNAGRSQHSGFPFPAPAAQAYGRTCPGRTCASPCAWISKTAVSTGKPSASSEAAFPRSHLQPGRKRISFTPAADRRLLACADGGEYHSQPEWSENRPGPPGRGRGHKRQAATPSAPAGSTCPWPRASPVTVTACADPDGPGLGPAASGPRRTPALADKGSGPPTARAAESFIAQRGEGKTVIAGYPWFLDWGRDTFVSARGLLAAGLVEEVKQLLVTFARFEKDGTLPNTIYGDNASTGTPPTLPSGSAWLRGSRPEPGGSCMHSGPAALWASAGASL